MAPFLFLFRLAVCRRVLPLFLLLFGVFILLPRTHSRQTQADRQAGSRQVVVAVLSWVGPRVHYRLEIDEASCPDHKPSCAIASACHVIRAHHCGYCGGLCHMLSLTWRGEAANKKGGSATSTFLSASHTCICLRRKRNDGRIYKRGLPGQAGRHEEFRLARRDRPPVLGLGPLTMRGEARRGNAMRCDLMQEINLTFHVLCMESFSCLHGTYACRFRA